MGGEDKITIYVVKYALTTGIFKATAEPLDGEMVRVRAESGFFRHFHKVGRDYCLTKEEAILAAEKKREKRLKSLRKSIDKLMKIDFAEIREVREATNPWK